jgi:putative ABC transport system permease protein
MKPFIGIQEGFKEIVAHKFRSFLTMLGVILGVAALMAMFALTEGMAAGSLERLTKMGGVERVEIKDAPVPDYQEDVAEISPGRTYRDVVALRRAASLLDAVAPVIENGAKITRGSRSFNPPFAGVEPDTLVVDQHVVVKGRFITDFDVLQGNRVVVLGHMVVEELWADDPHPKILGETVFINNERFTVVGVLDHYMTDQDKRRQGVVKERQERKVQRRGRKDSGRRWDPFWWKNSTALIPITTMQQVFKSANVVNGMDQGPDPKLSRLYVRIGELSRFEEALQQVRNVLMRTHRGIRDFGFDTREDWFDDIAEGVSAARITGGLIAGISLLVGGLGITNIMLASITERIREIGIRRAVGARSGDIFVQILIESLVLAVMGGFLGVGAGYGLIQFLDWLTPLGDSPIVTMPAILISLTFATFVGIIAGIYPAYKASQLSPLQALRYE